MFDYTDLGLEALNDKYQNRICVLWYKLDNNEFIGTGNLFEISGNQFIITCEHVASKFFDASDAKCKFSEQETIYRINLKLVYTDELNDLAIIQLKKKLNSGDYFTYDEIEVYDNFGDPRFQESSFYVCGLPSELTDVDSNTRNTNKLSLLTLMYDKIDSTSEYLYLDYPKISGDVDISPFLDSLPEPGGMSGSFIIFVPNPVSETNDIWSLDQAKVVAMLTMSDNKRYVKCVNIRHLLTAKDELI